MVLSKHAGLSQFSNWINTSTAFKILNDNHYLLNFIAGNNKLLASNIHWFVWPTCVKPSIYDHFLVEVGPLVVARKQCCTPDANLSTWLRRECIITHFRHRLKSCFDCCDWCTNRTHHGEFVCNWCEAPRGTFCQTYSKVQNNLLSEMILVTNATLQNFPAHLFSGINIYYTFLDIVQYYCCKGTALILFFFSLWEG